MNPQMMQMIMQAQQAQGEGMPGMPGMPGAQPGAIGGVDMAAPGSLGQQSPEALMGAMPQGPARPGGLLSRIMPQGGPGGGMNPHIMGLLGAMQGMGRQGPQMPQMQ